MEAELLDDALNLVKKLEATKGLSRKEALKQVAMFADMVGGELRLRADGSAPDED